jgi:hypothetical protein
MKKFKANSPNGWVRPGRHLKITAIAKTMIQGYSGRSLITLALSQAVLVSPGLIMGQ